MRSPSAHLANRRFTRALVGLMGVYALAALSLAVEPRAARFFMERAHLRTPSFVLWALTAPTPWMYNFDNRALVSERPLSPVERAKPPGKERWFSVNHQPTHLMTFVETRIRGFPRPSRRWIYLDTRYRSERVQTAYAVFSSEPGSASPSTLTIVESAQ